MTVSPQLDARFRDAAAAEGLLDVAYDLVDTPVGRVNTIVVKPETRYQGVLQKKGDSFLWLTDDDRRYIIRLEAKVKIFGVGPIVERFIEQQAKASQEKSVAYMRAALGA